MHNRPGDQLRKKHHEDSEAQRITVGHQPFVTIHQVGDFLEDEKGYAERQNHTQQRVLRPSHRIQIANKKIGILEITEYQQVKGNPTRQASLRRATGQQSAQMEVDGQ